MKPILRYSLVKVLQFIGFMQDKQRKYLWTMNDDILSVRAIQYACMCLRFCLFKQQY